MTVIQILTIIICIIIPFDINRLCGSTGEVLCMDNNKNNNFFKVTVLLHYLNFKCMIVVSDTFRYCRY